MSSQDHNYRRPGATVLPIPRSTVFLLAGCAVNTVNTPPTVDMRGVDGTEYANDLAACQEKARSGGFIQLGAPVSKCLEERGYAVTQRLS